MLIFIFSLIYFFIDLPVLVAEMCLFKQKKDIMMTLNITKL